MRKRRRFAAALLAACLVASPFGTSYVPAYGASLQSQQAQGETQESRLEVEVAADEHTPCEGTVTVEVTGAGGYHQTEKIEVSKGASAAAGFFMPAGEYTVQVRAEKFAAYTQPVQTEAGWTKKIRVCTAQVQNGGLAVPGWMRAGDIDGDGDLDDEDSKALLAAVHEKQTDARYDFNGDGRVDLADVDILVQGMKNEQASSVEKLFLPKKVEAVAGTVVDGAAKLEDLLQAEGTVRLKNAGGTAISKEQPVELAVTLCEDEKEAPLLGGMTILAPLETDADGAASSQIADGTVTVTAVDKSGQEVVIERSLDTGRGQASLNAVKKQASLRSDSLAPDAQEEADGSLVIDFGGQVAVKRVSIRITGTKKTQPLVEIARVTFVNDMEHRIPAPQMDVPAITAVTPGSKKLTVAWSAQRNVTGYELSVTGPSKNQGKPQTEVFAVSDTSYEVTSLNQGSLVNYQDYTVKVRSVNGTWSSPWSAARTAQPLPQKKPAPPDNVRAQGGYRSITVSWKDMDDADGYMVYYKESGANAYQPVVKDFVQTKEGTGRIRKNSYTITGLKEHVSYSVYVISWNAFGWSAQSLASQAETRSEAVPELPAYKVLNTSNGAGQLSAHIKDITIGSHGDTHMQDSPLDTKKNSGLGLADYDYASYWSKTDWDDGVSYTEGEKGITVTLDAEYQANYFTFAAADQTYGFETARVTYWNATDAINGKLVSVHLYEKRDRNGNPYYIVKLDQTVLANKIKLCLGRVSHKSEMKVGEIRFYEYDSLEDEIMALYTDEMHSTLKEQVTMQSIEALKARLETVDEASGEKHPLYQELALELLTAEEILTSSLAPAYKVNAQITAEKDKHLGFGGLNAWQPLGKAAYAGDTLLVYVGHSTKRTGEAAQLSLVFTQHHAESASFARAVGLKVGKNIVTVPQLSDKEAERGGQVYVAYTGNNTSDQYAVRLSGAADIPSLDLYGKTGQERTQAIRAYLQELESHTAKLEEEHSRLHSDEKPGVSGYDERNCLLNATDIQLEQMLYSLPATQVYNALGSGLSLEDKVKKLDTSLQAMEQMMTLFYQHKGLSSKAGTANGNNALPSQHLNIRYMRMFAGAFMYAAGNHIGIEWDSAKLASGAGSWNSFGWGIAHEIGHNINQGSYAVAEITNNYFAQLMKKIADGSTRFRYENVYKKVTSGTVGRSSNVATQLAMYWQLYLAYGCEQNDGRIYEDYSEQFDSLFFARVDTYSRNPQKAPKGGVTLDGGTDQNLMRLSCAAAQKNLLEFFRRWGMVPDQKTIAYAELFDEETKAIYYVNDEVRDYRISQKQGKEPGTILGKDVLKASAAAASGKVEVTITPDADSGELLGYEVIRSMTYDGEKQETVAGFQLAGKQGESVMFTDTIRTVNNRVLSYQVRAVDKYLNYSKAAKAGSVKIQTDGELDKSEWTAATTMVSDDDTLVDTSEEAPDSGSHDGDLSKVTQAKVNSIERVIDNDTKTEAGMYQEKAGSTSQAQITLDLHKTEQVTALKYLGGKAAALTVEISLDGQQWNTVKEGYEGLKNAVDTKEETIWFDAVNEAERGKWIGTYDARYVRLTFTRDGRIKIRELELCAPTGDNVEFLAADSGKPAVGKLTEQYRYGKGSQDVIPAGSLVFTGSYKGNPAYNVVVLYDTDGNVIGEKDGEVRAEQAIFAPDPKNGDLGETSDGTWVYYIEPGQWNQQTLQKIKGVRAELYRVDDAKTMKRERIVSDTIAIQIPQTEEALPGITFTGAALPGMQETKNR